MSSIHTLADNKPLQQRFGNGDDHTDIPLTINSALVAAASRFGSLDSDSRSKYLIQLGEAPLIAHCLASLYKGGVSRVVLLLGFMGQEIRDQVLAQKQSMYHDLDLQFIFTGEKWREGLVKCLSLAKASVTHDFLFCCGDHIFHPNLITKLAKLGQFINYSACVLAETDLEGIVGLPASTNLIASSPLKYGTHTVVAFGTDLETYSAIESGLFSCKFTDFFEQVDEVSARPEYASLGEVFKAFAARRQLWMEFTDGLTWFSVETRQELEYTKKHLPKIAHEARSETVDGVEVNISGLPNKFASPHSGDWEEFSVEQWRSAVYRSKSYFEQLTNDTTEFIKEYIRYLRGTRDQVILIEIGCGTGECLAALFDDADFCIGVDINPKFIQFCKENTPFRYRDKVCHINGDASHLDRILDQVIPIELVNAKKVVCCLGNTVGIMPPKVKSAVYQQMIQVAGASGVAVMVYWNGNWFGDAVQNFYYKNPQLCGKFDGSNVDLENLILETSTGYKTHWTTPEEAKEVVLEYGWNPLEVRESGKGVLVAGQMALSVAFSKEEQLAQDYYDSSDAFAFYQKVWGGSNIHVGLYNPSETDISVNTIKEASQRSLERLLTKFPPRQGQVVMDMGSAYGGCARFIAAFFGATVHCIDLSAKENAVNREMTAKAGLSKLVLCPYERSFTCTGLETGSVDLVLSQDAFLHAGKYRKGVMYEAFRVLRRGGAMVFSDIMQSDFCNPSDLKEVYDRIHLDDMGSVSQYQRWGEEAGLSFVEFDDLSDQLAFHYGNVLKVLEQQRSSLKGEISDTYMTQMEYGLRKWVEHSKKDHLQWGFLVFQKR